MEIEVAQRVEDLPKTYVFTEIAKCQRRARDAGLEILDFGVGDPDYGAPEIIVRGIAEKVRDQTTHRYPDSKGTQEYREAWADFYYSSWRVHIDPVTEACHLLGGKEGIADIPRAFVNPGDIVLCPDPSYPVYPEGTILADGRPIYLPLLEENGFLPDLRSVGEPLAKAAKIIWINSPNNPTGSVASRKYFEELAMWARTYNVMVFSDATYSHIREGGEPAPSFLQAPYAKDVGVEFHSASKILSFTGSRCGIVVGNPEIIAGLLRVKSSSDSGGPNFIQLPIAEHLSNCGEYIQQLNAEYTLRRKALQQMLSGAGFGPYQSGATFYVWAKNPEGIPSTELTYGLIEETGVVSIPGSGLGQETGEGFSRWSVACATVETIEKAEPRIRKYLT